MLAGFFRRVPSYFRIASWVSLAVAVALLIYSLRHEPGTAPELTDATPTVDVASAPAEERDEAYWSRVIAEGPSAGMTNAEAQRKINSQLKEMKAELEEMLAWYQEMGGEIEADSARIDELLARSKPENGAVLADHPAWPVMQRLFEEGYSNEEIARNPEFIRIMSEHLGIGLSTEE